MYLKVCHTREHFHLASEDIRLGHGSGIPSVGNFSSCFGYCKTILIATSKFFERFCIKVPKIKYCHEHTKEDFSQPCRKEVCHITYTLVTQPMLQPTPNQMELRLMVSKSFFDVDSKNVSEKFLHRHSWKNPFFQIFSFGPPKKPHFFRSDGGGTFRLHFWNLH